MKHSDGDDIIDRLQEGDVLKIIDQYMAYIFIDSSDHPEKFVMRRCLYSEGCDDRVFSEPTQCEESRHASLTDALLSLVDWEWTKKKA